MPLSCKANTRSGSRSAFIEANPPKDPAAWLKLMAEVDAQAAALDKWMVEAVEGAVRQGCPDRCKFMSGGWTHRIVLNLGWQQSTSPPLRVVFRVDYKAEWADTKHSCKMFSPVLN